QQDPGRGLPFPQKPLCYNQSPVGGHKKDHQSLAEIKYAVKAVWKTDPQEDQRPEDFFPGYGKFFQSGVGKNGNNIKDRKHGQSSGKVLHTQAVPHQDPQDHIQSGKNMIPPVPRQFLQKGPFLFHQYQSMSCFISCFQVFHIQSLPSSGTYSRISPGWQFSSRHKASRVVKRTALALPFFKTERLAGVIPMALASSPAPTFLLAIITSRFTIIGISTLPR